MSMDLLYKKYIMRKRGFSITEVLVAMLILSIFIAAFTPLVLHSVKCLNKAGYIHKSNADAQGKLEVSLSTRESIIAQQGEQTKISESQFPVRVSGSENDIEGVIVETGELKTFVTSIAKISIAPETLSEGYANDTLITIKGINTHFIQNHSKLEIRDNSKTMLDSSYYSSFSVSNTNTASFKLKQGFTFARSPYLISIKTGSEIVSAFLSIDLPNALAVGKGGVLLVSDGDKTKSWTVKSSVVTKDLFGIHLFGGIQKPEFFVFGSSGTLMKSNDASNWIDIGTENANDLYALTVRNSDQKAVITGGGGTVLASADDLSWNGVTPESPDATDPSLITWLKADSLSLTDNSWVSVWNDSTGTNDATAQGSLKPVYRLNVLNGKPVIRFDGTQRMSLPATAAGTDNFTVIVVAAPSEDHQVDNKSLSDGGKSGQHFVMGAANMGGEAAGMGISIGMNGASVYEHGDTVPGSNNSGYFPACSVYDGKLNAFNIITVKYSDRRPQLFVNGALVDNDTAASERTVYSPVDIGGCTYGGFKGDIAEILIFNKTLSETERIGLEAYLHEKYKGTSNYLLDSLKGVWSDGYQYYAVGSRSHLRRSADALTWESEAPMDSALTGFNAIAGNDNGVLVIVGDKGKIFVKEKEKNKNWIEKKNVVSENLNSIVWTGTHFIAVGANGRIIRSTDGNSWTETTSGSSNFNKVIHHFGQNLTIAVGDKGTIRWSQDSGNSWKTWTSGTNSNLYDIVIR